MYLFIKRLVSLVTAFALALQASGSAIAAYEAKARKLVIQELSEDPYGEGGNAFKNYDQEGDKTGSYRAKKALRNWAY